MDTYTHFSDHDLLAGGVVDTWTVNLASGARWARLVEFHRRREAAYDAQQQKYLLTARQETVVEVGELWGMSESWLRSQLNIALFLHAHFPQVWELCVRGQLDPSRATLIADLCRTTLDDPQRLRRLSDRLTPFLHKHLRGVPGLRDESGREVPPLVRCTHRQLRNKVNYELRKVRPAEAEERHRRALAERRVTSRDLDDGMAYLGITATADRVRLAERRLSLAARDLRAAGDERTFDQLRSDLAVDLLSGSAPDLPLPAYARPVINVTVPIQTLMGLSDDPGVLSGGAVIPAGLARSIAARPGSTWFRMLTDPAGRMVELSTKSYQPTGPIWRWLVADWNACYRPGCDTPAAESEADHRIPWPGGATSSANLWPGCKCDHKAKRTAGFSIEQSEDGSFALRTRAGFDPRIDPPTHPISDDWPDVDLEIHHSADEIVQAVQLARLWDEADRQDPLNDLRFDELAWEYDLPDWDPIAGLDLIPEPVA